MDSRPQDTVFSQKSRLIEGLLVAGPVLVGLLIIVIDYIVETFLNLGADIRQLTVSVLVLGFSAAVGFALNRLYLALERQRRNSAETSDALSAVLASARDAVIIADHKGRITHWSPSAKSLFGYSETDVLGKDILMLIPPRYIEDFEANCLHSEGGRTMEIYFSGKDGEEFPAEAFFSTCHIGGRPHIVGAVRNISEKKQKEEELRALRNRIALMIEEKTAELKDANARLSEEISERLKIEETLRGSERFYATIFDSIRDPFCIIDRDFRVVRANEAYAQLKDIELQMLIGKKCHEALHASPIVCPECVVEKTFNSGDPCAKDKPVLMPDGAEAWVEIYTYPIFGADLSVSHVIEYTRDITERKRSERERQRLITKLEHLSAIDSLTGLLNRRALFERLSQEMARAKRHGSVLSVILCDMDGFKEINDTYGHTAGDEVLRYIAQTLKEPLRRADIVGRYGGDEFMIILPATSAKGAQSLAERIRSTIEAAEFQVAEGRTVRLSVSIGVAECNPESDINDIVRNADKALYTSKQAGKNRVHTA